MATTTAHSAESLRQLIHTTTALVRALAPAAVEGTHGDLILHAPATLRGHREHLERLARESGCSPAVVQPLWDEERRVLSEVRAEAVRLAAASGRTLTVHPDWDEELGNIQRVVRS